VEAVIRLTHSLGMEVTGERVEKAEKLECLRETGCDLVQGYHLGAELEEIGRSGDLASAPTRISRLEEEFGRVRAVFEEEPRKN
jgi:EAL domain-containing protein (putative c-di-GMP-specific phosphodiesterase class I)